MQKYACLALVCFLRRLLWIMARWTSGFCCKHLRPPPTSGELQIAYTWANFILISDYTGHKAFILRWLIRPVIPEAGPVRMSGKFGLNRPTTRLVHSCIFLLRFNLLPARLQMDSAFNFTSITNSSNQPRTPEGATLLPICLIRLNSHFSHVHTYQTFRAISWNTTKMQIIGFINTYCFWQQPLESFFFFFCFSFFRSLFQLDNIACWTHPHYFVISF